LLIYPDQKPLFQNQRQQTRGQMMTNIPDTDKAKFQCAPCSIDTKLIFRT